MQPIRNSGTGENRARAERPGVERPGVERPGVGAGAGGDWDRPVTARSVVASVLLPMADPELSGRALVRCGELFGIAEGTVRVALSRMVSSGELEVGGGVYRLAGPLLERRARQEQGRRPDLRPWAGGWVVAVVVAEGRRPAERAALRTELRRLRLAERREGVWMRPDNLVAGAEPGAVLAAEHCLWMSARPDQGPFGPAAVEGWADGRRLAATLWDLDGWGATARRISERLGVTRPRLAAGDVTALEPGFRAAAAAVRHLTNDPLLPAELLPGDWPAGRLRADYDEYERLYRRVLRRWLAEPAAGSGARAP